jgi:CO/xanthine dehydrogenase FAD-binding subunit
MSVTVKTFARLADAAGALSSERGARFLAGGTLVMRAVNEADPEIETIVRSTDPTFSHISASSGRVELGAGVTMAAILAERNWRFSIRGARGRRPGRARRRRWAAICSRRRCSDLWHSAARDATVVFAGGFGQRGAAPRKISTAAIAARLWWRRRVQRPVAQTFRFAKVTRVHPKGISVLSIAAQLPLASGRVNGARIAYNAMDKTPVRAKAAERALEGRALEAAGLAPALAVAADGTAPVDDAIASAWWRREILPVHLRRLLLGAGQT